MRQVTKGLLVSGLCALILSACVGMASQTPAPSASPSERVRVAYVQPSSNQAPAWTAKEAGFFNTADFRLMADPNIKSVAELRGKTVAISNFESADSFMLTKVLNQNGL